MILEKICAQTSKTVEERKSLFPIKLLAKSPFFEGKPISLSKYLLRSDKSGIIAEFKRKSPSKGNLAPYTEIERTTIGYMQAGASALSVLTDEPFFGGNNKDLETARIANFCPILRKDFMLDEYQIIEAKSIGSDAILLIAAAISPKKCKALAALAQSMGMEVLLEIHSAEEIQTHFNPNINLIGVNNRNLKTFEVSIETSLRMLDLLPKGLPYISESGISKPETVVQLKKAGYNGFLIGEAFMKHSRPEREALRFIEQLRIFGKQELTMT